jgi:hypothetical protein
MTAQDLIKRLQNMIPGKEVVIEYPTNGTFGDMMHQESDIQVIEKPSIIVIKGIR